MMKIVKANKLNAERHSVDRIVAVLTISIATLGVNSLGFGPIASAMAADLGVTVAHVMVAAGGYGIGTALSALFLSFLIDRRGSKSALTASLFILAIAFVLSAVSPNAAWLIAAQCIAGLAAGVALPAIYAFAAQIAPKGHESVVLGRVLFGWTISMVAGVVVVTTITDLAHWRLVFVLLAVIAASASRLVALMADANVDAKAGVDHHPDRAVANKTLSPLKAAGIPGVLPLLVGCFAIMTTFYGTYGYLGDQIHHFLGQPLSAMGILAMVYGAGFGLAVFGDHYIDRLGVKRVLPLCLFLLGVIYAALGLTAASYTGLVLISFLWGCLNHFALNLIVAGLSSIDPARRGSILGLNSAVTYLSASVGVIAFGPLYANSGFPPVAYGSALILAVSAVYIRIWSAGRIAASADAT